MECAENDQGLARFARRAVLPSLAFESAAGIVIQRYPQESVGTMGMGVADVNGVWTPSRESYPPPNSYNNKDSSS